MLDIKLLFGAKREACTERESSVQVYIVLAISSKTNHHLFSLQNCRRAMGYNLVKVLIFKRVICGKRHQRVAKKENFVDGGLAGENCLIKLEIVRIFIPSLSRSCGNSLVSI